MQEFQRLSMQHACLLKKDLRLLTLDSLQPKAGSTVCALQLNPSTCDGSHCAVRSRRSRYLAGIKRVVVHAELRGHSVGVQSWQQSALQSASKEFFGSTSPIASNMRGIAAFHCSYRVMSLEPGRCRGIREDVGRECWSSMRLKAVQG